MKKILTILCCIVVLFTCFALPCFAAEDDAFIDDTTTTVDVEETPDVFTRLWEFVTHYKGEVFTLVGDGALIVLAVWMKLKNKKGTKEINDALNKIKQETGISLSNQNNVVEVINDLIDAYNKQSEEYARLREAYKTYGETEIDRSKAIGALAAEVSTVLDILVSVYTNNKNIPQGLKDLVTVKYAGCLKALESDEQLAALVNAVRNSTDSEVQPNVTEA